MSLGEDMTEEDDRATHHIEYDDGIVDLSERGRASPAKFGIPGQNTPIGDA